MYKKNKIDIFLKVMLWNSNEKKSFYNVFKTICYNLYLKNVIKYLVQQGANINKENNNGATPLFIACQYGHENVVKYFKIIS